jgi:hypothetical protein
MVLEEAKESLVDALDGLKRIDASRYFVVWRNP